MTSYTLKISEPEVRRYRMMAERAVTREADAWREAGFVPGAAVADIGCGPGAILAELARIVGPAGSAVGIERDPASAAIAEQPLAESGLSDARVAVADAGATGLQPASLDAVMIRHVLVHNDDESIRAILGHVEQLLRPGGTLYVIDTDLTAHRLLPRDDDLVEERERYHELLRVRGCDPAIGPRLGGLLADAGLETQLRDAFWEVIAPLPPAMTPPQTAARQAILDAGLATEEDGKRWDAARERFLGRPDTILFVAAFRAVGRRPV